jgi:signal peptidase II
LKQNKEKDNPVKKSYLAIGIILLVLLIDQVVKFWIKTTFALGEGFDILGFSWAKIHFVENEGMAFGMELGGDYGKLALSLFRLIAVFFIGYYLYTLIKAKAGNGLIISIALVFAGAMGNIIDSVFYGVIFFSFYIWSGGGIFARRRRLYHFAARTCGRYVLFSNDTG